MNKKQKNMNNSFVTSIQKLNIWSGGNWNKHNVQSNLILRLYYDQLIISSDDKILESLHTSKKLKGIVKEDVIILIISIDNKEIRKIKFQIRENLSQCLKELKSRFPIVSYGAVSTKLDKVTPNYDNLEDVFKTALEGKVNLNTLPMPENYKNFVKLCLLDPTFPKLIEETKKILDTEILNKDSLV